MQLGRRGCQENRQHSTLSRELTFLVVLCCIYRRYYVIPDHVLVKALKSVAMTSADYYFSVAQKHLSKSRLIDAKNTIMYALRLNPHHTEAEDLLRRIHDGINEKFYEDDDANPKDILDEELYGPASQPIDRWNVARLAHATAPTPFWT